jgi:hypothetical protein
VMRPQFGADQPADHDAERRERRSPTPQPRYLLRSRPASLPIAMASMLDGGQHSVLEHRDLLRAIAALPAEQRAGDRATDDAGPGLSTLYTRPPAGATGVQIRLR